MKTLLILWLSCALVGLTPGCRAWAGLGRRLALPPQGATSPPASGPLGAIIAPGDSLAERSLLLGKPTFESTNFVNILHWEPIGEVPPDTVYDVEYKTYGDDVWHEKSECQNISARSCDLTRETEIIKERYHAQVRAVVLNCCHSEWVESTRFCPWEQTNIGDLKVNYTPGTRTVKFVIQPPYTPFRDEENHLQTVEDIFNQHGSVEYHITVLRHKKQQVLVHDKKEFELSHLEPGTEYTGTIQMVYLDKKSKPYEFRVRTLSDNTWLSYLFGAAVFMAILICATICYFIYKYIKLHAVKQPRSLGPDPKQQGNAQCHGQRSPPSEELRMLPSAQPSVDVLFP
ncbi:hypothetical protein lerEdw1_004956 [Lerista edwardsae]|nr:hypothetical protein lerEdw1_004956 [Lerista edwardsae]